MFGFTQPPKQSSLPVKQVRETAFQSFNDNVIARVEKNDDYDKGKIEVIFVNRTKPAPVWVFDGPKPEVGDYVLVGYINGQKNNPYMQGIFSNKAWTSNFIVVEKDRIRIAFPTDDKDVTGEDPEKENDPKSHLRDDATYQWTRGFISINKDGMIIHVPKELPVQIMAGSAELRADSILVDSYDGGGSPLPIARQGDPVEVEVSGTDSNGDSFSVTATGTITTGSSRIQST
jgi:hypothetical protein